MFVFKKKKKNFYGIYFVLDVQIVYILLSAAMNSFDVFVNLASYMQCFVK